MASDPILWINVVLGSIEILVIAIFTFHTIKYVVYFKKEKLDPYTIGCFCLVFLTAIFKILPRFFVYTLRAIQEESDDPDFQDWYDNAEPALNCMLVQTGIFPNFLFTIAILFNACRWLVLVLNLK